MAGPIRSERVGGPTRPERGGVHLAGLTRLERTGLILVVALTAAAGVTRYLAGTPHAVAFVLAGLALIGLAWLVSTGTEQVGTRTGPGLTGLLQSTVGNLPEFFVVLFALRAGDAVVAETAIVGSILVNALLVLGIVLLTGSLRAPDRRMTFSARLPNDTATLLLIASLIIGLLGLAHVGGDPAARHAHVISIVGAGTLLVVYGIWLRQYLTSPEARQTSDPASRPRLTLAVSVGLLVLGGAGSAFVSDWFVHALEPTIHHLGISQAFAGLVIVAIAGNAAENTAGVVLAVKGQSDLSIAVVKSSVAQLAAFLYPLLVLVSLATRSRLTFSLAPVDIGAVFGTAVLIWQITGDGEATPFEGVALMATYVIVATIAGFEH